ncbi:hypothetical protein LX36DRAFT_427741 [Colletotrichum falcatum]|nr:hypothetical protein LX36DRAFT_427741 [Colletotrichum falcatum]
MNSYPCGLPSLTPLATQPRRGTPQSAGRRRRCRKRHPRLRIAITQRPYPYRADPFSGQGVYGPMARPQKATSWCSGLPNRPTNASVSSQCLQHCMQSFNLLWHSCPASPEPKAVETCPCDRRTRPPSFSMALLRRLKRVASYGNGGQPTNCDPVCAGSTWRALAALVLPLNDVG